MSSQYRPSAKKLAWLADEPQLSEADKLKYYDIGYEFCSANPNLRTLDPESAYVACSEKCKLPNEVDDPTFYNAVHEFSRGWHDFNW